MHDPFRRHAIMHAMRSLMLVTVAVAFAACSNDTGPAGASRSMSLSVTTKGASTQLTGSASRLPGLSGDLIATSGNDTLVITRAEVVLSRLELASGLGTNCDEDGDGNHMSGNLLTGDHMSGGGDHEGDTPRCNEIKRAFVLIDLPTDTSVHTLFETPIPAGTYSSLEARLRVPHADSDTTAAAFLLAHPEFAGANVRVTGTFNGTPFVYTGAVNSRLEMDFDPPITVDSTGRNITINVDLDSWFRDRMTGALIDPTTANTGGANVDSVVANIRRSFHEFRDDHGDGHDDDHGEQHQGSGGGDN